MLQLNVNNETSRLLAVVLGTAKSNGPDPMLEDCYDPISRENILANGFVVGKKYIYLSTNNGRLFLIDTLTGKTSKIIKIDNQNISGPFVVNRFLYLF